MNPVEILDIIGDIRVSFRNGGVMHSIQHHIRFFTILSITLVVMLTSCGNAPSTSQNNSPSRNASTRTPTTKITLVPAQNTPGPTPVKPTLKHIFVIMMENHATNQIIGNSADAPYLNQLAASYGVATHYYGVTHPSLPNYLAAISGDFQGIWDDCPAGAAVTCFPQEALSLLTSQQIASASARSHMFGGQTIIDQLEAHNLSWKAYMQSLPSIGYTGASYALYAQKHNPFMYFSNIRNNPNRMQRIVPLTQFSQDVQSRNVPNFVWISPDVCHDMHGAPECASYDGAIALGDQFVHSIVQEINHTAAWQEGSAIVIAWDENNAGFSGCCKSPVGVNGSIIGGADVPIIVMTSKGPHHIILADSAYNHYSLLATIERLWNLGCLANTCSFNNSQLMTGLFE
jgi:phosphatidylinositol-3-phosphatase